MSVGFSRSVRAQHCRLQRSRYDDVYVVGDVHGCREALERLDTGDRDLVVLAGDLVRRGPDSGGVVDLVRDTPNVLSVRGNNEEKLIRGRREAGDLSVEHLRFLRSLPLVVSWEGTLVVHGGLDPHRARSALTTDDLQNTESFVEDGETAYWWERYGGPERVFFGHKVLSEPLIGEHAVGLDTGCVYGGRLTAFDCTRERTVSVEPARTHRERAPERFLDPPRRAVETDAAPTEPVGGGVEP